MIVTAGVSRRGARRQDSRGRLFPARVHLLEGVKGDRHSTPARGPCAPKAHPGILCKKGNFVSLSCLSSRITRAPLLVPISLSLSLVPKKIEAQEKKTHSLKSRPVEKFGPLGHLPDVMRLVFFNSLPVKKKVTTSDCYAGSGLDVIGLQASRRVGYLRYAFLNQNK